MVVRHGLLLFVYKENVKSLQLRKCLPVLIIFMAII